MSKIFSLYWISLISQEELSLCAVALGNLVEPQVVNNAQKALTRLKYSTYENST